MDEIAHFWQAFYDDFEIETSNRTCGSHVHIAPLDSVYNIRQLRKIAYAAIIYEKHVLEILPQARRDQDYCRPNTNVAPELIDLFLHGMSKDSYAEVRQEINDINNTTELCTFMQGDDSRYVLWNFRNTLPGGSGTIEFRGIPGVHSGQETIHWILFAVGFILLALEEVSKLKDHRKSGRGRY